MDLVVPIKGKDNDLLCKWPMKDALAYANGQVEDCFPTEAEWERAAGK